MKCHRLATVGVVLALPVGAVLAPAGAVAKAHPKHKSRTHHGSPHRARSVTFTAQVVRAGAKGLILRRSDGRIVSFSTQQIMRGSLPKDHKHVTHRRHGLMQYDQSLSLSTGNLVVNIFGLQAGVTVDVAESIDDNGNVTVTITLPPAPIDATASGVVTELDSDALTVQAADGTDLRLHMSADALSALNLQTCDTVEVSYHQDAGILVADTVGSTGASTSGDCAPTQHVSGTITQISDGSITVSADSGPVSINVDPTSGLLDGYQVGDLVDVVYTQTSDGSMNATDIQFVEEDASGQVTSVATSASGGSVTITDADTGQSDTFLADPSNGVQINARAFNGVSVGDQVGISYHQSGGQLLADIVSER